MKEVFSTKTYLFLPLFLSGSISKKRKFDKIFINSEILANNYAKKEINLNFTWCGCLSAIELNRPWQIELFEWRSVYIIETILLAAAIYWDPNFMSCLRHMPNFVKKLDFKTRNLFITLVKE